jgi:hypothetical protein
MRTIFTRSLLVLTLAGCGSGRVRPDGGNNDTDGGTQSGTLVLAPADAVLTVDGVNAVTQAYTVTKMGADVTASATFFVDNGTIGTFSGNTFTSLPGGAGKTTVHATVGNDTGSTTLTLQVGAVVIAPGTPPDAPSKFGGAPDQSFAPDTVYPPDGALVPPNLSELEIQWHPGQADLFEIGLTGDALNLLIYTVCVPAGDGCALEPDQNSWNLLSNAARGGSVQITIRGTSMNGGGVGTSSPRTLSFAEEDMKGGLYYWAASSGGIYRYDFGLRNQKGESFYTPQMAGGVECVGCHALSRDGSRIAVGFNTPGSQIREVDVATRKTIFDVGNGFGINGSDYETLLADASKIVTTESGGLTVRDATTGNVLSGMPALANADMPDFSPDGKSVVFARGASSCMFGLCEMLSVQNAGIFTASFNGTTFGKEQQLVAPGPNNYYPSYSPDGAFVAFNRAAGDSYNATDARLMIVSSSGGAPVDIMSSNGAQASWPKWAPFIHHFNGGTIMWLSFSSTRPYGLRQPMEMGAPASQLWFVPVQVEKLQSGTDPGFPPLWLPFQDVTTGNHIAQWVEKIDRAPCSQIDQSGCMDNEMCVNGMCVPNPG